MLNLVDLFDENFYLETNPDVDDALSRGIISNSLDHYLRFGQIEGRNPSLFFDHQFYLETNPGVAEAVEQGLLTAVEHFIQFGQFERRDPNSQFNTTTYLLENQDLAEALENNLDLTPFQHFVEFGIDEGRTFAQDFIGTQFDIVVTSAANNGNSAALRFDGLTGRFIGEFPIGGGLTDPRDIVLEPPDQSTVLINSGDDNVLRFQASDGTFINSFIEFPNLNGGGAVFGPDENYYVGARSLGAILRFNGETGEFIDEFIPSEAVDFPRGFVFGLDGNFYLGNGADPATGTGGGSINQYDGLTGELINSNFVNDPELSPLDVINGLDGNLYVSSEFPFGSDEATGTVRVYDIDDGTLLNVLNAGVDERGEVLLAAPRGIGFGPDNHLYVSSTGTGSLVRFDGTTGEFIDVFIEFPNLNGQALNFVPSID
ncbi:MAG: hypothetical protein VKK42_26420 [Lyngbya sp.]|nr:hypothetical protein [Lyngbya sp.]